MDAARQAELLADAGHYLAGGGTGLFVLPPELNLVVARGEGSRVWDFAGREYLDYHLSSGPALLGHAHPAVTAACPAAALDLAGQGRLLILPPHPGLAVTGLTPDPLPAPLLAAAHDLLRLIPTAGNLVERTTR